MTAAIIANTDRARRASLIAAALSCVLLLAFLIAGRPLIAEPLVPSSPVHTTQDVARLFAPEMQQAVTKLKWHGEHLGDDTIYAIALTGLSWQEAWGKEHLFDLAWGDGKKVPVLARRPGQTYASLVQEVRANYDRKDYQRAIDTAYANFSLEEIGCNADLKEAVGYSLLGLQRNEQAFPIFATPFEPTGSIDNISQLNRHFREAAFTAAQRAGLNREAIAFSLSLLLEPGVDTPKVNLDSLNYLLGCGVDVDRVFLGILEAPEKLRGFPSYYYAAMDLLTYRANPRLLPFFLDLAKSDDVYLRARALFALGLIAYQPRPGDPPDWPQKVALVDLHQYSVSVGERKLIDKELTDGANSDKYRIRVSAALAIALAADDANVPLLQKLAKDRTYVFVGDVPDPKSRDRGRIIEFPVRTAAAVALARYGIPSEPGGGDLGGRDLDRARRGCQDETNDRRNLRREVSSQIVISPIDIATPLAFAYAGH